MFEAAGLNIEKPSPEGASLYATEAGACEREQVFSQVGEGNIGLYMAARRDLKYIYSAADDKEWLFNLRIDPAETKNWAGNSRYESELRMMRETLIERFEGDGYETAVQAGKMASIRSA